MNNRNISTFSPFVTFCQHVIPLAYDESMSYYETLCALRDYLVNTVIPAVNNNADAVSELQQAFETLQNYVDNYFKNLDVQTEINNKLDEMAKSGELTDIIAQYLQVASILAYNTISDLKNATNLNNGSYAKTYGFYKLNDGGGAFYKIRTPINTDDIDNKFIISLKNNLVAELIIHNFNVKQIGAYGNGVNNDDEFIQAAVNKLTNVFIPKGNYLLANPINLNIGNKLYGENETILLTNDTNHNLLNINADCIVHDLEFKTPKSFNQAICEISSRTLDGDSILKNINVYNIRFTLDLDINDIPNKLGDCFLIFSDTTVANSKFNNKGIWKIYLNNIYVKGSCQSVVHQYCNKSNGNWLNGCTYTNFTIDSAPLYGFLGFKEQDTFNENFEDGDNIVFTNWQMQCGNSKNIMAFSSTMKYLRNIYPWDWKYVIEGYKQFAIAYNPEITGCIYLDGTQTNLYDQVQVINAPSPWPKWQDEYLYINKFINNGKNLNENRGHQAYKGNFNRYGFNSNISFSQNSFQPIKFQKSSHNEVYSITLNTDSGQFNIREGITNIQILMQIKLVNPPTSEFWIAVRKNNEIYERKYINTNDTYINFNSIVDVKKDDIIDIAINPVNNSNFEIDSSWDDQVNVLKILALF